MASSDYLTELLMSTMDRIQGETQAGIEAMSTKSGSMEPKIDTLDFGGLTAAEKNRTQAKYAQSMIAEISDRNKNSRKYESVSSLSSALQRNIRDKQKAIKALEGASAENAVDPVRGTYTDPVTGETKIAGAGMADTQSWKEDLFTDANYRRLSEMRKATQGKDNPDGTVDYSGWTQLTADPQAFEGMSQTELRKHGQDLNDMIADRQQSMLRAADTQAQSLVSRTEKFALDYAKGVRENQQFAAAEQRKAQADAIQKQQTELQKSIKADQQSLARAGDSVAGAASRTRVTSAVDEQRPI